MKRENIRRTVVAGGFRTLRLAGLLAIGIGIGVAATEMLPEPVAAASSCSNSMRCDSVGWWWWAEDVCRYSPNSYCWFINPEECSTRHCSAHPCDDDNREDEECNPR